MERLARHRVDMFCLNDGGTGAEGPEEVRVRVVTGFLLGALVGVPLGYAMGLSGWFRGWWVRSSVL